jgi:hypothetical protein
VHINIYTHILHQQYMLCKLIFSMQHNWKLSFCFIMKDTACLLNCRSLSHVGNPTTKHFGSLGGRCGDDYSMDFMTLPNSYP